MRGKQKTKAPSAFWQGARSVFDFRGFGRGMADLFDWSPLSFRDRLPTRRPVVLLGRLPKPADEELSEAAGE